METTLHSHELGDVDGLPVLFVHGWEMNSKVEEFNFEPIFSKTHSYRRIYVDLPGMGKTPANGIKNQDDIYRRLVHFIDSRIGQSKFLLIGTSCGGHLARAVAHEYADQVVGLLLRVPLIEPGDDKRDLDPFTPLVADEHFMSTVPAKDKEDLGDVLVQTPAYIEALMEKYKEVYIPAVKAADSQVLDPIRADPKRYQLSFASDFDKARFLAPTLIVCGRQDAAVGYRDSARLLELYPRSTYVVLDRGVHGLPVGAEQGAVFEALVRDWLFRVDEWQTQADK